MLDKNAIRLRRIELLVRDLNKQLTMAANERVPVNLQVEDQTKRSDAVPRLKVVLMEIDAGG